MLQREKAGAKRISAVTERQTLKAAGSNPIGYAIAEPLDISADIKRLFFYFIGNCVNRKSVIN